MTTTTAVARAVARDAEARARAALDDVLAAHKQIAVAAATTVKAAAAPALARAIAAALAAGITTDQMSALGITVPSARTRRRSAQAPRAATERGPVRPADPIDEGQATAAGPAQS